MGLNKDGYYTLDDIKKTGCQWRWIFGPRAPGKSAAVKTDAMKRAWVKKLPTMGLIRRRKVETETSEIEHYFEDKDINFVEIVTDGECDHVEYFKKYMWFAKTNEDGSTERVSKLGEVFCLSTAKNKKSTGHKYLKDLIYEEVMTDEMYLPDEPAKLMQLISTLLRLDDDDVTITLIGNAITRVCPYFREWGLDKIPTQPVGTIDVYHMRKEDGTTLDLAVEYCPPTPHKNKLIFGRSEKSIQGSHWETHDYNTAPVDKIEEEFEKVYELLYHSVSGFKFLLTLIVNKDNGAPFVYVKPYDETLDNPDIVRVVSGAFSTDILTTPTLDRNSPPEVIIHNCFVDNKVYYVDNLTGEDFVMSCKSELKYPF